MPFVHVAAGVAHRNRMASVVRRFFTSNLTVSNSWIGLSQACTQPQLQHISFQAAPPQWHVASMTSVSAKGNGEGRQMIGSSFSRNMFSQFAIELGNYSKRCALAALTWVSAPLGAESLFSWCMFLYNLHSSVREFWHFFTALESRNKDPEISWDIIILGQVSWSGVTCEDGAGVDDLLAKLELAYRRHGRWQSFTGWWKKREEVNKCHWILERVPVVEPVCIYIYFFLFIYSYIHIWLYFIFLMTTRKMQQKMEEYRRPIFFLQMLHN